jgi:hypothetical protein
MATVNWMAFPSSKGDSLISCITNDVYLDNSWSITLDVNGDSATHYPLAWEVGWSSKGTSNTRISS